MRISDWSSDVYSSDLALAWVDEDIGVATERLEFTIARRRLQRTHAGGTDSDHAPTTGATGRHRIDDILAALQPFAMRSEERRVGQECVSTCRYRWSP